MPRSPLHDAFAHHTWATLRLIDACASLDADQLDASHPGTYGSIIDTLRHLVASDASYLAVTSGGAVPRIDDEDRLGIGEMRAAMERHATAWADLVDSDPDPDRVLVRHRDDGSETSAPMSVRLAQALHHGTDHRSQVCTVLTTLGVEPPEIDVWDYAYQVGLLTETPPTS